MIIHYVEICFVVNAVDSIYIESTAFICNHKNKSSERLCMNTIIIL